MKLPGWLKWALRQSLGTKRGEKAIEILSGPIGMMVDMSVNGQGSLALEKMDDAVGHLRGVIAL